MKKITLVVMDKEREKALDHLREVGVVHIENGEVQSPLLVSLLERKAGVELAAGVLRNFPWPKKAKPKALDAGESAETLTRSVHELVEKKKMLFEAIASDSKDVARVENWGDFDPESLNELKTHGIELEAWELSQKRYATLANKYSFIVMSSSGGTVRTFTIGAPLKETGSARIEGEQAYVFPERSLGSLKNSLAEAEQELTDIDRRLAFLSLKRNALIPEIKRLETDIEYEMARAGMQVLEDCPKEGSIAWLSGFVPAEDSGLVRRAAAEHGWALVVYDPIDSELPPTKVKNSPLVRIIQPVFNFLGTVPSYHEYDISAWFLLFFSIFFAMIFGDGGYGSILLLISISLVFRSKAAGKTVPDIVWLMSALSACTVVWGTLTLSWFGIAPDKLPQLFHHLDIWWLSNANPESGENVKVFCFLLGTVQLALAHAKNIKRDISSLKVLAQFGQMAMVIGMMSLVLNLVISSVRYPLPQYALVLIGAGFILNFVFANWETGHGIIKGLVKAIVGSLTNIVSVFLGVVNVFADIVSYIRLWAVGLAGVAISQTVNSMAGPLLGSFTLFIVGVIILGFGHGLNILMSVLSVIVHGVRLNVLEFSSHLGMEWSGYAYDPFRERIKNRETLSKEQS